MNMRNHSRFVWSWIWTAALLAGWTLAVGAPAAYGAEAYRLPPQIVIDTVDAPPTPSLSLSPARTHALLLQSASLPSIAEMAWPMLRLAGVRINPKTGGRHGAGQIVGLTLLEIESGRRIRVALPDDPRMGAPLWSPDGLRYAFTQTTDRGIELWAGEVGRGRTSRLVGPRLNAALGSPVQWMPDGENLLVRLIPERRGEAPLEAAVPEGPIVQESFGRAAPKPTYQDLLKSPHDAALFKHHGTSQLALVSLERGRVIQIGKPGVFIGVSPSPGGSLLLVTRATEPYSYLVPYYGFARRVELWNRKGNLVRLIADLPSNERVPVRGVPEGPRSIAWRPDRHASLAWVEALDGGDENREAPRRDKIMTLDMRAAGAKPREVHRLEHRFRGLIWREEGGQGLVSEFERDRRWSRIWLLSFDDEAAEPRLVWDLSSQDAYGDPGSPITRRNAAGKRVLAEHEGSIFLRGPGASPEGARPFLDKMSLATLQTERLWRCEPGSYESVVGLLADDAGSFVTRRESKTEPPNYFVKSSGGSGARALTDFPHPAPWLKDIKKELVTYERGDGVPLSGTLYLPPDYAPGRRYPMIVWAYPREFSSAATAGQVRGTPHRFTSPRGASHLFYLTQGYAVFDGPAMPVIGDPETANDTYIEQIVAASKAAIDKAVDLGVADRTRVGVGGHSYGAFMTANLLAHSDLFTAGIARSGAYNRTLTPFGFQNERRTFWQAPQTYFAMSPFMHADKVNEPILLIHGQADNNSGTFPIQSDRYYRALKGHGARVRYVQLPHESHGYRGRESVLHTLAEMIDWADEFVKNARPHK